MLTLMHSTAHFSQAIRFWRWFVGGQLIAAFLLLGTMRPLATPDDGVGQHRTGAADSRIGYETAGYVTQSRVIVQQPGSRALHYLSEQAPLGLPPARYILDPIAVDLGRRLFFDRRLSQNDTLSCAMCHIPEQGFTQNELATPVGHLGNGVRRNVPSLYNVAYVDRLFLDGRERSLEEQVWSPLLASNEMANKDRASVLNKLANTSDYVTVFSELYEEGLTEESLGMALAAYQRALLSADAPFDRWRYGTEVEKPDGAGNNTNYPSLAAEGYDVFTDKGCASCHQVNQSYALLTDGLFHNTGVGYLTKMRPARPERIQISPGVFIVPEVDAETETFSDEGRYEVTGQTSDRWRYRTPSLRNVALTGPYMHDGSIPTLEGVLAFYGDGGGADPTRDARIKNLRLSQREQAALLAFLHTLTSDHVDKLVSDARSTAIGERLAERTEDTRSNER